MPPCEVIEVPRETSGSVAANCSMLCSPPVGGAEQVVYDAVVMLSQQLNNELEQDEAQTSTGGGGAADLNENSR